MTEAATLWREIPSQLHGTWRAVAPSLGVRNELRFKQFHALERSSGPRIEGSFPSFVTIEAEARPAFSRRHAFLAPSIERNDLGLFVEEIFTRIRQDRSFTVHLTVPMTSDHDFDQSRVELGKPSSDLARAVERLTYLRGLSDGWLGDRSSGATADAGKEAEALLRKLAVEMSKRPLPKIGLDADGTIVMSWNVDDLIGSLSVFGDGTYSYFVTRGTNTASNGEALISQPLDRNLVELLAA